MEQYVAYYRVSTAKQGKSGLGLAAQKEVVAKFIGSQRELLEEYVEIESGRKDNREVLWKAISHAKQMKAKLVIARLDRFSRRVSFISNLMEQGIGLTVAEIPTATDFQLHIFAALAQEERRLISDRTKAALNQAKKRGVVLGKNGKVLAAINKRKSQQYLEEVRLKYGPEIRLMSCTDLKRRLNADGVEGPKGGSWYHAALTRLISLPSNLIP